MTDEEMKEIIRRAAIRTVFVSQRPIRILSDVSEVTAERFNELVKTARVSVTWDGDKP